MTLPSPQSTLFPYTTLFRSAVFSEHAALLEQADIVFADAPKDGRFEPLFLQSLESLRFQKPDRKSTRLNSSHEWISYAVFCLKKKRNLVVSDRLAAEDPDAV